MAAILEASVPLALVMLANSLGPNTPFNVLGVLIPASLFATSFVISNPAQS